MRTPIRLASVCLTLSLTLTLGACEKHDSDNILTSGMYASMIVSAEGNGQTRVAATLFLGNPISLDFIELQGDDQLLAVSESVVKEMIETDILNIVSYSATFDGEAEGVEYSVQFFRTVDEGAPLSFVTLPAPFDIN